MSSPFVVDTSVFISYYNKNLHHENLLALNKTSRIFISIVTMNELIRGAHDSTSHRVILELLDVMQERFITPNRDEWLECARISERILKQSKKSKQNVLLLQNDLLIALGAKRIGASVVTEDKKDFSMIEPYVGVSVIYWS